MVMESSGASSRGASRSAQEALPSVATIRSGSIPRSRDGLSAFRFGRVLSLPPYPMRLLVADGKRSGRDRSICGRVGFGVAFTLGDQKERIVAALEELKAGGSTNGAEGIALAYKIAGDNFIKGGVNRVILATDGDFSVGVTSRANASGWRKRRRRAACF